MLGSAWVQIVAESAGGSGAGVLADGSLLFALLLAFAAGLLSFASPCVLPLVPGYLALLGASSVYGNSSEAKPAPRRWHAAAAASLFVLGFTTVFMVFAGAFGAFSAWLLQWQELLIRVFGAILIFMGLVFLGSVSSLQRVFRVPLPKRGGLLFAPLLGVGFALGWTPCIGPSLALILSLTLQQGSAPRGFALAFLYSLGLGLPFIAIAIGLGFTRTLMQFLRAHVRTVHLFGGGAFIVLGVLMVSGLWSWLLGIFQNLFADFTTFL